MLTRLIAAFTFRDYRILWVMLIIGSIAFWMRILGTAQWLLEETGSAYMVGLIGVVQLIVQLPITLWAGTLADRVDRKRLMSLAHGATGVSLVTLGVLSSTNALTPVLVYVGIAITAGTHMLASPARGALLAAVVPEGKLMLASSTDTASANAAAIAGPLLFAGIVLTADLTTVFLTAGCLALVNAILPMLLRVDGHVAGKQGEAEDKPSQIQQTRAGLRYVGSHPILPGLFLLDVGITTASFYREVLPVIALGLFAGGASATGMLGAANSAGAILGSFIALALAGVRAKGMLVLYASFAYGVILFGLGIATTLLGGMLMIALLGAADAVTVAVRQTTVLLTTPDEMRGRAYALMILAAQTANNIGTIWVGFWAGAIGAGNTMVMGGIISITATAVIWYVWKPIGRYRSAS
ncbi:MFS transporter [Pseudomonadales bacterium]|nr:MFS transporter [Pseudomonadales bacterium]